MFFCLRRPVQIAPAICVFLRKFSFPLDPMMMRARLSTGYHTKEMKVGVLQNGTPVKEAVAFLFFEMSGLL
jgi:hypothetical protein